MTRFHIEFFFVCVCKGGYLKMLVSQNAGILELWVVCTAEIVS